MRAILAAVLLCAGSVHAQDKGCTPTRDGGLVCPPPDSTCLTDRYGDVVCSSPGGGILLDRYGDPLCGPGYCTKDLRGDSFCSSAPRGAASTDRHGNAACAVSCVSAKTQLCVRPKPVK